MKRRPADQPAETVAHPLLVPHAALAPDPEQPRRSDIYQGLEPLVESIRALGIIQPILVRPHPDPAARARTPYLIVCGERRWTAAGRAGRDEVPVFLLGEPLSQAQLLILQIAENDPDNRQDLSFYDQVSAVARAFKLEGGSQAGFARRHKKSEAWVSYRLHLYRAGGAVGDALREGYLGAVLIARTFQRLPPEHQRELLARARKDGTPISLAAAERFASRAERQLPAPDSDTEEPEARPAAVPPEIPIADLPMAAVPPAVAQPREEPPAGAAAIPAAAVLAAADPAAGPVETAAVPADAAAAHPNAGSIERTPSGPAPGALLHYRAAAVPAPESAPVPSTFATNPAALAPDPAAIAPDPATTAPAAAPDGLRTTETPQTPPALALAPPPTSATRSAAAGLLAAAWPPAGGPGSVIAEPPAPAANLAAARITVDLSLTQLQKLVRLLGLEPAATPRALVQQLMTCL